MRGREGGREGEREGGREGGRGGEREGGRKVGKKGEAVHIINTLVIKHTHAHVPGVLGPEGCTDL